jgi:DNA-binding NtrC family response regulator
VTAASTSPRGADDAYDRPEASSGLLDRDSTKDVLADLELTEEQRASIEVVVVDDERSMLESTANILTHEGYRIRTAARGSEAESMLRAGTADIVILDLYMSGVSGIKLLEAAVRAKPSTIVIVITGRPSVRSSIEALREGAWAYLPKPFSATQLQILVGRAALTVVVGRESEDQVAAADLPGEDDQDELLGESPAFRSVVALARRVAPTDASIFITGESGTGKELIAQFIHRMSRRRTRGMVEVNCAALPEQLLESEMFGHVKGAFTGATQDKTGLMEAANGGTLFLDELTEMSPQTQAKLLRVVQDGLVRRVGSSKTDAIVNVRFVSATNRDPRAAIDDGRLREDLFYRLGVVPIHIPPLRERPEDISVLARYFAKRYWRHHFGTNRPPARLTDDSIEHLVGRRWKGNVRELQNVIEHAVVLASDRDTIEPADLSYFGDQAVGEFPLRGGYIGAGITPGTYHDTRDRVIARFEKEYLSWILQETDGNVSQAARIAGVHRATLYRLLERHELTKRDVVD